MKVLSNSNSSVSWRLNGLLRAREKAKAFAATSWSNPGEAGGTASFTKWQPKVLSESGAAQDFVSASELNRQVDGQQGDAEQEILDQAEAEVLSHESHSGYSSNDGQGGWFPVRDWLHPLPSSK